MYSERNLTECQLGNQTNFPAGNEIKTIEGPWQVTFDTAWGGPEKPVAFDKLEDWIIRPEPGIRYYSGAATYRTSFDLPLVTRIGKKTDYFIDLGIVNHIAKVKLNGKDLGVIWTAPWGINVPWNLLNKTGNNLEIEVTNVWVNRLVGDEQEPPDAEWAPAALWTLRQAHYLKEFPEWFVKKQPRPSGGRYCFTTWNYFTKDSPLVSSGLLGPVKLQRLLQ